MAGNKKSRAKKSASKDSGERRSIRDLFQWAREKTSVDGLSVFGQRVFLLAFLAFLTWGSLEIKTRVEGDPRYQVENWTLHFGEFPKWVWPEIRAEIEAICEDGLVLTSAGSSTGTAALNPGVDADIAPSADPRSATVFHEGLFDRIRSALLSYPWVRSVPSIRLRYPGVRDVEAAGGLEVDLELRRPIAMVQYEGKCYLTDHEARRLGKPIDRPFDAYRLPVIVGAERFREGAAPRSGDVWDTREILEGLAVAWQLFRAGLDERYPHLPVDTISIGNVGGVLQAREPEIILGIRHLPPVGWGRSPISRGARAVALNDKLAELEKILGDPRDYVDYAMIRVDTPRPVGVSYQ